MSQLPTFIASGSSAADNESHNDPQLTAGTNPNNTAVQHMLSPDRSIPSHDSALTRSKISTVKPLLTKHYKLADKSTGSAPYYTSPKDLMQSISSKGLPIVRRPQPSSNSRSRDDRDPLMGQSTPTLKRIHRVQDLPLKLLDTPTGNTSSTHPHFSSPPLHQLTPPPSQQQQQDNPSPGHQPPSQPATTPPAAPAAHQHIPVQPPSIIRPLERPSPLHDMTAPPAHQHTTSPSQQQQQGVISPYHQPPSQVDHTATPQARQHTPPATQTPIIPKPVEGPSPHTIATHQAHQHTPPPSQHQQREGTMDSQQHPLIRPLQFSHVASSSQLHTHPPPPQQRRQDIMQVDEPQEHQETHNTITPSTPLHCSLSDQQSDHGAMQLDAPLEPLFDAPSHPSSAGQLSSPLLGDAVNGSSSPVSNFVAPSGPVPTPSAQQQQNSIPPAPVPTPLSHIQCSEPNYKPNDMEDMMSSFHKQQARLMGEYHSRMELLFTNFMEQVPAQLKTIAQDVAHSHTQPPNARPTARATAHPSSQMDFADVEEDDDEDEGWPVKTRRGPSAKKKILSPAHHSIVRKICEDAGVLPKKPRDKELLPQSPPVSEIMDYEANGDGPGPQLPNIRLNWASGFRTGRWNTEAVTLLAKAVQDAFKNSSKVNYDESTMTVTVLEQTVIRTLRRTMNRIKLEAKMDDMTADARSHTKLSVQTVNRRRLHRDRVTQRRQAVFKRRQRTIDQNSHRNPRLWRSIQDVLEELDFQSMSGDETDVEASTHAVKKTTKLTLPWINESLTKLWSAVDTYTHAVESECVVIRHVVGNPGLAKSGTSKEAKDARPTTELPSNWYNSEWIARLSAAEKIRLMRQKPRNIPILEAFQHRTTSQ